MTVATRLAGLHPELRRAYDRLTFALSELGHPIVITDGARTAAEQAQLYAKGRTIKGEPPYTADKPLGRTVTDRDGRSKAEGGTGLSTHQRAADGFGYAMDCAFLHDGRPCWCAQHPWRLYGEAGKALGLRWGGDWTSRRDQPHLELDPAAPRLTPRATPPPSVGSDVPGGGAP